jgi:hypothetical protein
MSIELDPHEAHVVHDLSTGRMPHAGAKQTVRAAVIRDLLFRAPVKFPGEHAPRVVDLPTHGVALSGLRVAGKLDLRHAIGPRSEPLSPLQLHHCEFLDGIDVEYAHLRGLSFADSALTHIAAEGVIVDGPVDISGIHAQGQIGPKSDANVGSQCSADFSTSIIRGHFIASRAQLNGPAWSRGIAPPLKLHKARIEGDCRLDSRETSQGSATFVATGGIAMTLANVSGDLLLHGALLAGEHFLAPVALDMGGATVGGDVYMSPRLIRRPDGVDLLPFEALGTVDLTGLKVERSLHIVGAMLHGSENGLALRLFNTEVGELLELREFNPEENPYGEQQTRRLVTRGKVLMVASEVKSFFRIVGADIDLPQSSPQDGQGGSDSPRDSENSAAGVSSVEIAACTLNQVNVTNVSTPSISFQSSKVALTFDLKNLKLNELYLTDVTVSTDLNLESVESLDGAAGPQKDATTVNIGLVGAEIGGTLSFDQKKEKTKLSIDLNGCTTGALDEKKDASNWGPATHITADGFRPQKAPDRSTSGHLRWLRMQYEGDQPSEKQFFPNVYSYLARQLREEGQDDKANRILSEKLTVEKIRLSRFPRLKKSAKPQIPAEDRAEGRSGDQPGGNADSVEDSAASPLELPFLIVYWAFRRAFWHVVRFFFDYGLSPIRTVFTFAACVLIGWAAAHTANYGFSTLKIRPVMVATSKVSIVAVPAASGKGSGEDQFGLLPGSTIGAVTREISCGQRINTLVYAFTTFVPILDLHEDKVCEISEAPDAALWRLGKFLYSLLGWIVSSITLLALPGFIRAQAEKEK